MLKCCVRMNAMLKNDIYEPKESSRLKIVRFRVPMTDINERVRGHFTPDIEMGYKNLNFSNYNNMTGTRYNYIYSPWKHGTVMLV